MATVCGRKDRHAPDPFANPPFSAGCSGSAQDVPVLPQNVQPNRQLAHNRRWLAQNGRWSAHNRHPLANNHRWLAHVMAFTGLHMSIAPAPVPCATTLCLVPQTMPMPAQAVHPVSPYTQADCPPGVARPRHPKQCLAQPGDPHEGARLRVTLTTNPS